MTTETAKPTELAEDQLDTIQGGAEAKSHPFVYDTISTKIQAEKFKTVYSYDRASTIRKTDLD
ncbi:MAG: hypothetical protein ACFB03_18685 [Paracoccaceae bacterium]